MYLKRIKFNIKYETFDIMLEYMLWKYEKIGRTKVEYMNNESFYFKPKYWRTIFRSDLLNPQTLQT